MTVYSEQIVVHSEQKHHTAMRWLEDSPNFTYYAENTRTHYIMDTWKICLSTDFII